MTPREQLALLIEGGSVGSGSPWSLEIAWPSRYEADDILRCQKIIADFVREGIMEGHAPTWKVRVDPSINLDLKPIV